MEDDIADAPPPGADSLLPYDQWTQEAHRQIVGMALAYVAANGMPGDHHFYLSFRTDVPGVTIPPRLLAQYPHEMTIVLQHQFWDLKLAEAGQQFSVGLSFNGIPSTLVVPLAALTGFADPHVQFGLRFTVAEEAAANDPEPPQADPAPADAPPPQSEPEPQVVSLAAFRKRGATKEPS